MKLIAAGCSFIFGNELSDTNNDQDPSQLTFSALLADYLNLEYQCVAVPGTGSDTISRQVIKNFDYSTKFVLVCWSYAGRFEFNFKDHDWQGIRHLSNHPELKNCTEPFSKMFYANLTKTYQWYNYVKDIVFLQQWLKSKKVPYLFCSVDPDFTQDVIDQTEYVELYKSIDWQPWFFWKFNNRNVGFVQWTANNQVNNNDFKIGKIAKHPLEYAHQQTFEQIKKTLTWY